MQIKRVDRYEEPEYPTLQTYQRSLKLGGAALLASAMVAGAAGCTPVAPAGDMMVPSNVSTVGTEVMLAGDFMPEETSCPATSGTMEPPEGTTVSSEESAATTATGTDISSQTEPGAELSLAGDIPMP